MKWLKMQNVVKLRNGLAKFQCPITSEELLRTVSGELRNHTTVNKDGGRNSKERKRVVEEQY